MELAAMDYAWHDTFSIYCWLHENDAKQGKISRTSSETERGRRILSCDAYIGKHFRVLRFSERRILVMVEIQLQELQKLCAEWQKRLHLQAWNIDVNILPKNKMDLEDTDGEIWHSIESVDATINLLDPGDARRTQCPYDMEMVLVHELLHTLFLPFAPEDEKQLQHKFMERAIDHIAHVLVEMKREEENAKHQAPCTDSQAMPSET